MKTQEITTTDLSKFGKIELTELAVLIKAMDQQGLPDDFNNDEVTPMFNTNSGNVFLTNSDFQVAMMNGDDLESFYSCPNCGHEGFKDEMDHNADDKDCQEYLKDIKAA
jgi:hypothetical protein